MSTYSNSAREVEMPDGNVVVLHSEPTGGANTTSNIKKFKYDDNGHVTESSAANATDLNLNSYSTPTTGSTDIGTSDAVQTAIGKLDHQSHIDQTNILYALNTGVKNLIAMSELSANYHGITVNRTPKGVTISGTADADISLGLTGSLLDTVGQDPKLYSIFSKLPNSVKLTGAPDSQQKNRIIIALYNDATWVYSFSSLYDMPQDLSSYTYNRWYAYIPIVSGTSYSGTWYPMLQDASISDDTFVPGALPNSDLTQLEAEDRAALAEEIDAGAKNILDFANVTVTDTNTTSTKTSTAVTVTNSTAMYGSSRFSLSVPSGSYTLSFKASSISVASGSRVVVEIYTNSQGSGVPINGLDITANGNYELPFVSTGTTYYVLIYPSRGTQVSANTVTISDWMICTKAAFCISPKFVAYQYPTKNIFCQYKRITTSTTLSATGLSYTIPENGVYRFTALAAHSNSAPDTLAIYHRQSADGSLYAFMQAYQPTDKTDSLGITGIVFCNIGGEIALYSKYTSSSQNTHGLVIEKISDVRDF